jgi:hypothetical protein
MHDAARSPSQDEIATTRLRSLRDGNDFAESMQALAIGLSLERLVYFSHWRTPAQSPKRYDTRFFMAAMPPDQAASHCNIETTDSLWISPRDALARNEASELRLVFPTRAHITRLLAFESVRDALEFARTKEIHCVEAIVKADRSVHIAPELIACW